MVSRRQPLFFMCFLLPPIDGFAFGRCIERCFGVSYLPIRQTTGGPEPVFSQPNEYQECSPHLRYVGGI